MNSNPSKSNRARRNAGLALAGLLLLSLLLNLWGVSYGLPDRFYPDEGRIVNNALAFGLGDFNPHYFLYPALTMYLLFFLYGIYYASGHLIGFFSSPADFQLLFFSNPTSFYLIGRIANALAGTAAVFLLYKLGKETFGNRKIGFLAAALLATLPYYVFYSHFIVTDILQILFILGSYIFIVRIQRTGRLKNYFWAGALAGLGTATKYSPALLVIPIALAHVFYLNSNRDKLSFSRLFGPVSLAGGCVILFFFIGSPYNFLDYRSFYESLQFRMLVSQVHTFGTMDPAQTAWLVYPRLIFFHAFTYLNRLDPAGFIFAGGVIWAAVKRTREDFLLLLYPLLLYLSMGGWSSGSTRYALPLIPFLALWGARAAVEIGQILRARIAGERLRRLAAGGLNGFIALAIVLSLANTALSNHQLTRKDTRTLAREWVETNLPPGTSIALEWDTEATVQLWETPDDIREKIRAYETGETMTEHHTSEQMIEVHRKRLEAIPELNYRITKIGGTYGTTQVSLEGYSIEELREGGVDYLITSAAVSQIFLGERGRKIYPEHYRFYRRAEEELPLVAVFRPVPLSTLGPEIRIYRLD